MESILRETEQKMHSAIEVMDKRFVNIRVGRANPSILDGVLVNYYGAPTPLIQLATISIPEARQLCIKAYDRSSLGAIEKAIYEANVGLTPNNNGDTIILNIPPLTEDTRREYVKQVKVLAEDCRIALRNVRQDANNDIKRLKVTEDEKDAGIEEVQQLINKFNKLVDDKFKVKEQEVMCV